MQESSLPPVVSRTCTLVSFVVIVGILYWFRDLFIPLALSVLLTFLLAPVATRLERLGAGRIVAAVCARSRWKFLYGGIGLHFHRATGGPRQSAPAISSNHFEKLKRSGTPTSVRSRGQRRRFLVCSTRWRERRPRWRPWQKRPNLHYLPNLPIPSTSSELCLVKSSRCWEQARLFLSVSSFF